MAMQKIKKDDVVIVITGKDKGRSGKVIKMLPNNRVLVEGINLLKKHVKPNPNKNEQGGIIEREGGIHISNVAIFNSLTKKADRVGFKILKDGKKVRCFKSNDEIVDV
jgi:large subunit ribosomal protein L24